MKSVGFTGIHVISSALLLDNVIAEGMYDGSQLKKDSTNIGKVQAGLTVRGLDFSRYPNPDDGNARHLQGEDILL